MGFGLFGRPAAAGLFCAVVAASAGAQAPAPLKLPNMGLSFTPRADAGSGWGAMASPVVNERAKIDVITGSTPSGHELRFHVISGGQPKSNCEGTIADQAKGDMSRRHRNTSFLPLQGWYGEALLLQKGFYFLCHDGPPYLTVMVEGIAGRPAEGLAVRGVLEPLSAAATGVIGAAAAATTTPPPANPASATAPGAQTVWVSLSRNNLGFELPGGAWTWVSQPIDLGGDAGAVLVATHPTAGKLQLGIRAVPTGTVGNTGCMELTEKYGYGRMYRDDSGYYIRRGYSQYYGKRGENDLMVCKVGRRQNGNFYYTVTFKWDTMSELMEKETARFLERFNRAADF